jgi:nucleoside phosphorylase
MNKICSECKRPNLSDARYCQFCGSQLPNSSLEQARSKDAPTKNERGTNVIYAPGSSGIVSIGSNTSITQNVTNTGTQINNLRSITCPQCQSKIPVTEEYWENPSHNTYEITPMVNKSAFEQSITLLIVTATKNETKAFLDTFCKGESLLRKRTRGKTYYNLGMCGEAQVFLVQSEMGTMTPGGSLVTVYQAIEDLHPQAVIMGGIAYGLKPHAQQLGDILISTRILCYEPQKIDLARGEIPRGDRVTVSRRMLDRFRSGDLDWQGATIHFGLILTGEKLVNDPKFRDWLLKEEPEAIGGEMESGGLYVAASDAKVDWVMVKAICDWADGSKNDDAQQLAALHAAQFVSYVINQGGWNETYQVQKIESEMLFCPKCGLKLQ